MAEFPAVLPLNGSIWQSLLEQYSEDHQLISQIFTHVLKSPLDPIYQLYIEYIKRTQPNFLQDAYQYTTTQLKYSYFSQVYQDYISLLPTDDMNKIRNVYKSLFEYPRYNLRESFQVYSQFESKDVIGTNQLQDMTKQFEHNHLLFQDVEPILNAFQKDPTPQLAHELVNIESKNIPNYSDEIFHQRISNIYQWCLSFLPITNELHYWLFIVRFLIHIKNEEQPEIVDATTKLGDLSVPIIPQSCNEWYSIFIQYAIHHLKECPNAILILAIATQFRYPIEPLFEFITPNHMIPFMALSCITMRSTDLSSFRSYFSQFRKWLNQCQFEPHILSYSLGVFSTSAYCEYLNKSDDTIQARIFELGMKYLSNLLTHHTEERQLIVDNAIQYCNTYLDWLNDIGDVDNMKSVLTRCLQLGIDRKYHSTWILTSLKAAMKHGDHNWMTQLQGTVSEYRKTKEWEVKNLESADYNGTCLLYYYLKMWNQHGFNIWQLIGKEIESEENLLYFLAGKEKQVAPKPIERREYDRGYENKERYENRENRDNRDRSYDNRDRSYEPRQEREGRIRNPSTRSHQSSDHSSPLGMPNSDLVYGLLISLPKDPWTGPIVDVQLLMYQIKNTPLGQRPMKRKRH
eukprot:NODE_258_length_11607_cov_1.052659.p2 type:complete len:629 gc:universal NODE_258_length_11607_cov_1.052659:3439-5325(+)